jgi:hypothetical protein
MRICGGHDEADRLRGFQLPLLLSSQPAGQPADPRRDGELAEIAALALPGEHAPAAPPLVVSNTRAAVAAYAEAISDGIADELRRRLFRAIWAEGRHLSSAYEVRRLVTRLMWPQEDIGDRLASPDIPGLLDRDPDLARITRKSGGTIAPDGGPLTAAGWQRIRQWRADWLALPSQVIPADLAAPMGVTPAPHAHAGIEPTSGRPAVRAA